MCVVKTDSHRTSNPDGTVASVQTLPPFRCYTSHIFRNLVNSIGQNCMQPMEVSKPNKTLLLKRQPCCTTIEVNNTTRDQQRSEMLQRHKKRSIQATCHSENPKISQLFCYRCWYSSHSHLPLFYVLLAWYFLFLESHVLVSEATSTHTNVDLSIQRSIPNTNDNSSNNNKNSHKQPTLVSGYGSTQHKVPGSVNVATTTIHHRKRKRRLHSTKKVLHEVYVTREDHLSLYPNNTAAIQSTTIPLVYLHPDEVSATNSIRSNSFTQLHVYSSIRNQSVCVQRNPTGEMSMDESSVVLPTHSLNHSKPSTTLQNWIPVEGLFGVYDLPSGQIYVWIVHSQIVYDAPPPWTGDNSQNASWWQIRKATELYLTRVVSSTHISTLPRAIGLEETRQLALLRNALKQHEWYFCATPTGRKTNNHDSISFFISDMTRNLQSSVLSIQTLSKFNTTTDQNLGPAFSFSCTTEQLINITLDTHVHQNVHNKIIFDAKNNMKIESCRIIDKQFGEECATSILCFCNANTESIQNTTILGPQQEDHSFLKENDFKTKRWWEQQQDENNNHSLDSRFFWNEEILRSLVQAHRNNDTAVTLLLELAIPVTSAFCGVQKNIAIDDSFSTQHSMVRYDEVLISRRSRFRAGTRFTMRGADATGAVANYAETEQIILLRDNHNPTFLKAIASHVQTRGSIPLRWSSPTDIKTYRPRVRIGTDPIAQARAMRQHLVEEALHYVIFAYKSSSTGETAKRLQPSLLLVNLIDKKSDQGRLGRAMDSVLKAVLDVYKNTNFDVENQALRVLDHSEIKHVWYDFHAQVKTGRWDKLASLLEQVQPTLAEQGYFCALPNSQENKNDIVSPFRAERLQTGVVRTNCMDCLDRTNVVQSIFGRFVLFQQLAKLAHLSTTTKKAYRYSPMILPWSSGELAHRLLWADNADAISRLYAGTPALKGDFTRTGKRTKKGALDDGMNSLQRYYLNNFQDADRQEGIDLLLGYQHFSSAEDELRNDDPNEKSIPPVGIRRNKALSIQEAAREILMGSVNEKDSNDDAMHVRIKFKPNLPAGGASFQAGRFLELRWLPGDLQTQVRSLISSAGPNEKSLLRAMDQRSSTDLPWWVDSDTSIPSDNGDFKSLPLREAELATNNNPGYLIGTIIAGTRFPLATASLVVAVTAVSISSNERRGVP